MTRRVIVFVDNNEIKVVTGSMVISTPLDQVSLPHRRAYFDNLFSTCEVVWVTGLEILSRDVFYGMIGVQVPQAQTIPAPMPMPMQQPQQQVPMNIPSIHPQQPTQVMQQPVMMQPQPQMVMQQQLPRTVVARSPQTQMQQQHQQRKVFEDGNKWVIAESEATIIVDDLPTGGQVRSSGRPETLALIPGKPVNLARFNSEAIRKSSILKSLARTGIVKPISSDLAHKLLERFENDENRRFSAKEVAAYEGSSHEREFVGQRQVGGDAVVIDLDNEGQYQNSEIDSMRQIMQEIDLGEEERMIRVQEAGPENQAPSWSVPTPRRLNRPGRATQQPQQEQQEQQAGFEQMFDDSGEIEMLQ